LVGLAQAVVGGGEFGGALPDAPFQLVVGFCRSRWVRLRSVMSLKVTTAPTTALPSRIG
jgi:hypothetical protein